MARDLQLATLLGRDSERAQLEQAVTDARLGASRVTVVWGDAGIGKTALLRAAIDRAKAESMEVLTARGVESEAEVPFGGLLELLRPVLDDVDRLPPAQ